MQSYIRDVYAVYDNVSRGRIHLRCTRQERARENEPGDTHETEHAHRQRRLSTACTTQKTHSLLGLELESYTVQDRWQFWCILDHEVLHRKQRIAVRACGRRPICRRAVSFNNSCRLLRKVEVFHHTLDRAVSRPSTWSSLKTWSNVLQVKFQRCPKPTRPVHRCGECHSGGDTHTSCASLRVTG